VFGCFEKSVFVRQKVGGGEHSVLLILFDPDPILFTVIAHTKSVTPLSCISTTTKHGWM